MTNATGFAPRAVLADRLRTHGLATNVALVAGGALFTAALAQVEIPMWPVPITGQTLAVVLVGATLGARRGILSMLVYAVAGLAGAPFFADMQGGLHALTLPSFGYVIGFVPAAGVIGWLARRSWDRRVGRAAVAFTLASAIRSSRACPTWPSRSVRSACRTTCSRCSPPGCTRSSWAAW